MAQRVISNKAGLRMGKPIYKELVKHLQSRSRESDGNESAEVALFVSKLRRQCDVRNCFGQKWHVMEHLLCHDANVRNSRSLCHRGNRANIQDDPGHRRACFKGHVAQIISYVTNFHALFDISAALNQRVKYPRLLTRQRHNLFDPHGMLDHYGWSRKHLQITHYVEASIYQCV